MPLALCSNLKDSLRIFSLVGNFSKFTHSSQFIVFTALIRIYYFTSLSKPKVSSKVRRNIITQMKKKHCAKGEQAVICSVDSVFFVK